MADTPTPTCGCTPDTTCGAVYCTVRKMIHQYPGLFTNRTQALHHLFCIPGGGYEWYGGRLLSVFGDDPRERDDERATRPIEVPKPSDWEEKYDPEGYRRDMAAHEAERERLRGIRARAAELAATPGPLEREPHEYWDRLPLEIMPEDVQPDWAAAAEEIAAVVRPLWARMDAYKAYVQGEKDHHAKVLEAAIDRLTRGEHGYSASLAWGLKGLLRRVADHNVHPHPRKDIDGVWACTVCGDLDVTPERCPGFFAYQVANAINEEGH